MCRSEQQEAGVVNPAERQIDAERALAALLDADTLLFVLGMSPAESGRVSVSALRPIVAALHESLPSLRRVVEAHDEEKAAVADEAYAKGRRDALATAARSAPQHAPVDADQGAAPASKKGPSS